MWENHLGWSTVRMFLISLIFNIWKLLELLCISLCLETLSNWTKIWKILNHNHSNITLIQHVLSIRLQQWFLCQYCFLMNSQKMMLRLLILCGKSQMFLFVQVHHVVATCQVFWLSDPLYQKATTMHWKEEPCAHSLVLLVLMLFWVGSWCQ